MKKTIAAVLVVLILFQLMGCTDSGARMNSINHAENKQKITKMEKNETLTGTLNVYAFGTGIPEKMELEKAKELYHQLFPNVELKIEQAVNKSGTVEEFTESVTKLQAEIMVGKGPDVIWVPGEVVDPYKTVEAGAYLNLFDFFDNDPYFNPNDFNMSVIQGNQLDGQLYIIPLSYTIPLFLTTENIISQTGFQISKC